MPGVLDGRTLWRAALAALFLTTLGHGTARAYRPFDFTDAAVAERHRLEIELGPAQLVDEGETGWLQAPNLALSYGFSKGVEFVFDGVNRVAIDPEPGEKRMQIEDVALGIKQVMRPGALQDEDGPSLAVEAEILFPPPGETHAGVAATGLLSVESKAGTTHLNAEVERAPDGVDGVALAILFEGGEENKVAPVFQVAVEMADGEVPTETALAGLIFVPHDGVEYDVAVKGGRSGGEHLFELRAGLTFQIRPSKYVKKVKSALRRRRH